MSASHDNEPNVTQTAAPDDQVTAVPARGKVVQSQTQDPQLEDSVSGDKEVGTAVSGWVVCRDAARRPVAGRSAWVPGDIRPEEARSRR